MTIEQEARRAAEKINAWADEQFNRGVESAQGVKDDSFIQGYIAGATRPVTDADVRALWDALGPGATINFEFEELRAALEAARAAREETNHA